jgi:hypothetical protein
MPMKKRKKLITFTDNQLSFVEEISNSKQISFSESLRRILDEYIEKKKKEEENKNAR